MPPFSPTGAEPGRGPSLWPPKRLHSDFGPQLGSEPAGTGIKLARLRRVLKPLEGAGQLVAYVVGAGVAGVIAAIPPARRAARLNVLDAISGA